ncbi:hypothetical protein ACWCQK_42290, partial [Streptomyces sp. NPDC002306]
TEATGGYNAPDKGADYAYMAAEDAITGTITDANATALASDPTGYTTPEEIFAAPTNCQELSCHYGHNNYNGRVTPGSGASTGLSPIPVFEADGYTWHYRGESNDPFYATYCAEDGPCTSIITGHTLANGLSELIGASTSMGTLPHLPATSEAVFSKPLGRISAADLETYQRFAQADAAAIGAAMDSAGGQRIFYVGPSTVTTTRFSETIHSNAVAARFYPDGNISWDSKTTIFDLMNLALPENARRGFNNSAIATGTHGTVFGEYAVVAPSFNLRDFGLYESTNAHMLDHVVYDAGDPTDWSDFQGREAALGNSVRQWCFSTASNIK